MASTEETTTILPLLYLLSTPLYLQGRMYLLADQLQPRLLQSVNFKILRLSRTASNQPDRIVRKWDPLRSTDLLRNLTRKLSLVLLRP